MCFFNVNSSMPDNQCWVTLLLKVTRFITRLEPSKSNLLLYTKKSSSLAHFYITIGENPFVIMFRLGDVFHCHSLPLYTKVSLFCNHQLGNLVNGLI